MCSAFDVNSLHFWNDACLKNLKPLTCVHQQSRKVVYANQQFPCFLFKKNGYFFYIDLKLNFCLGIRHYVTVQGSFGSLIFFDMLARGHMEVQLVEALHYKPEGCGYDS
jgi:hypothetical protein